jgi:hypothetical protein
VSYCALRQANRFNHDPKRKRRLLLHKREIRQLWDEVRQKGVTIVPSKVYLKEGRAKIEIALAKGKKLHDKRDSIAQRDQEREMKREARIKIRERPSAIMPPSTIGGINLCPKNKNANLWACYPARTVRTIQHAGAGYTAASNRFSSSSTSPAPAMLNYRCFTNSIFPTRFSTAT